MRVDQAVLTLTVTGKVKLNNTLGRYGLDEALLVEGMVLTGNKNVVDVEKQPAIGTLREFGNEFPFVHFGFGKLDIRRDILDRDLSTEIILNLRNARGDMVECFLGIGNGQ